MISAVDLMSSNVLENGADPLSVMILPSAEKNGHLVKTVYCFSFSFTSVTVDASSVVCFTLIIYHIHTGLRETRHLKAVTAQP